MSTEVKKFGTLKDGRDISLYILKNENGTEASFTDLGAAWVSMMVKDREGNFADVVFGYDDPEIYFNNPNSCGETIGRCANRTSNAKFTLDGKEYELGKNQNGLHNRHSGPEKWCKVRFTGEVEETKLGSRVNFHYIFPDGYQGFPGNLDFTVSYTLAEDDSLTIEYNAVADKKTIINPTNHAYFNLRGHNAGDIGGHLVWINADYYTPTDAESIPTGELADVVGTPMDFTLEKPLGQDIDADFEQLKLVGGYDHNWCINRWDGTLRLAAKAKDPESGRKLKVYTTLPGVQFYTGNGLKDDAPKGKGGADYSRRTGFCFEGQYWPDAVNKGEDWPKPVFEAGEPYHHYIVYKFVTRMDETDEDEDESLTADQAKENEA